MMERAQAIALGSILKSKHDGVRVVRKLFVSADMEGLPAVSAAQALAPDRWSWEWTAARNWMTQDVIAVAETAFASGYQEVIVADSHGNAHNIDPDALPNNVRLVRSWPRPLLHMQGVDEVGVDACAFIGYHTASTEEGSILAHTYSGAAFRAVRVNGEICSEGYLNAALAGEFGRAVIFVSGDQRTVEDAQRYAPKATVFVAKKSLGWRSQMSLPPKQVRELLREAVSTALHQEARRPFILAHPLHLELEMTTQLAAEMLAYLPNVIRRGSFSVATTFDRMSELMKFVAFVMLYTPTGVPAL